MVCFVFLDRSLHYFQIELADSSVKRRCVRADGDFWIKNFRTGTHHVQTNLRLQPNQFVFAGERLGQQRHACRTNSRGNIKRLRVGRIIMQQFFQRRQGIGSRRAECIQSRQRLASWVCRSVNGKYGVCLSIPPFLLLNFGLLQSSLAQTFHQKRHGWRTDVPDGFRCHCPLFWL